MSLELSFTKPKVTVMTPPTYMYTERGPCKVILLGEYEIPLDDFCKLVEYVLTNTDLDANDPRLELVDKIKRMEIVDGFATMMTNTSGSKRLK